MTKNSKASSAFRKTSYDSRSARSGFSKSKGGNAAAKSVMSGLKEGNLKHQIFQGMDNNSADIINKYDP